MKTAAQIRKERVRLEKLATARIEPERRHEFVEAGLEAYTDREPNPLDREADRDPTDEDPEED